MISIYALINPLDGQVFYIGASQSPKLRMTQHYSDYCNQYKGDIIETILAAKKKPELLILEEKIPIKKVSFLENFYIDLFKSYGYTLHQNPSTYSITYENKKDINGGNYNASSIKLGELLTPLQEEAKRLDRSLNWLVRSIIQEYLKNKNQ